MANIDSISDLTCSSCVILDFTTIGASWSDKKHLSLQQCQKTLFFLDAQKCVVGTARIYHAKDGAIFRAIHGAQDTKGLLHCVDDSLHFHVSRFGAHVDIKFGSIVALKACCLFNSLQGGRSTNTRSEAPTPVFVGQ